MRHKILIAIIVVGLVGVFLSGLSILEKRAIVSGSFCTFSDTFDCNAVNQSIYSEIYGIPVSVLGVVGYGAIVIAAALLLKSEDKLLRAFLLLASVGGFLFALYLTGIEAFVLKTYCLICLTSQLAILVLLILSVKFFKKFQA